MCGFFVSSPLSFKYHGIMKVEKVRREGRRFGESIMFQREGEGRAAERATALKRSNRVL